jgi:NADP-reducing hydrogenase subunit HndC
MACLKSPHELDELEQKLNRERNIDKICVTICSGTGCIACRSQDVVEQFERVIAENDLEGRVTIRRTGCYGLCERGPIVVILPERICYLGTKAEDVTEIVSETFIKGRYVERLLYEDLETGRRIVRLDDIPFYKNQERLLLEANSRIDPKSIEDYIAIGGYSALAKALFEMDPENVIDEIEKAGLRGRGGGGFPTGMKWRTTRNVPDDPKYIIVNADEGDPGAYMDRSVLEGNPHSVLEGLIIGAYAIGSREGYIYVRQEYPLAVENMEIAIDRAKEYGLLGEDILGSGFDFDVAIQRGAGAFVSGESSALMSAIEGRVGEPKSKYVHTAVRGLWNKPTCLNNVETFANVPLIINNGSDWFGRIGVDGSRGTKIFSLVGKVNNTGLVEVPMGMTLRQIVYDIGGGIPGGKKFKAVQTGGPSGGVLPESMLDIPVDFERLEEAGSMMGSGGMIVMDEDTCMVDTARYYVDFLAHESCGKCVPCREGLRQMLRILDNITCGKGQEGDIELLEELSEFMKLASLCALGSTAPNPVLSTIAHFRDEYEAHIKDKRCPAGVCKDLIAYQIDSEACIGCGACAKSCPTDAIAEFEGEGEKSVYAIEQEKCVKCGNCMIACPPKVKAVEKVSASALLESL